MASIPGLERSQEKEMATHSSILAWDLPWTEEPGGLQSVGSQESDMTERLTQLQMMMLIQDVRWTLPLTMTTLETHNANLRAGHATPSRTRMSAGVQGRSAQRAHTLPSAPDTDSTLEVGGQEARALKTDVPPWDA